MYKTLWNKEAGLAFDCKDHPKVRSTSYIEIHNLIGTSGCSKEPPYWDWSVLGILDSERGKTIVYPGDVLLDLESGETLISLKIR